MTLRRAWFSEPSVPLGLKVRYVSVRYGDWDTYAICCPLCGDLIDDLIEPHGPGDTNRCAAKMFSDACSPPFGYPSHRTCDQRCYCDCHFPSHCCCWMIADAPLGIVVCPIHGLIARPKESEKT